jgi:hypothetical protein
MKQLMVGEQKKQKERKNIGKEGAKQFVVSCRTLETTFQL